MVGRAVEMRGGYRLISGGCWFAVTEALDARLDEGCRKRHEIGKQVRKEMGNLSFFIPRSNIADEKVFVEEQNADLIANKA